MIYIFLVIGIALFCFIGYYFSKSEEFVLNQMKEYVNNYTVWYPFLCYFFRIHHPISTLFIPAYITVQRNLRDHVYGNFVSVMENVPGTSKMLDSETEREYSKRIRLEWIEKELQKLKEKK